MEYIMTVKNRGLGRGLNALFEDEETTFATPAAPQAAAVPAAASTTNAEAAEDTSWNNKRRMIGVDQLTPGKFQPRTFFKEESIAELAESIKQHGLLQPIIVRQLKEEGGHFEIIAGERRWRAAQKAQLHEVPAIIMELTDTEALEIALVENLQREDLNPVDEAMGYKKLMEEFSHTQEQLAEVLGKSRSHVANMVRLLGLPDVVLGLLERGELTTGHARALVTAKNPEALAKEIVARRLSVREAERLSAASTNRAKKSRSGAAANDPGGKDVDTLALERDLSTHIGMRVSIDSPDGESGRVTIDFKSLDQLDELLKRLSR